MRAPQETFGRARTLRRTMTLPEIVLWQVLRQGRLAGLRFRRQHPVGPYVLDFYCTSSRLAVEIDGEIHGFAAQVEHDRRREEYLRRQGIQVLRIAARDVLSDERLEGVLAIIVQEAGQPLPP